MKERLEENLKLLKEFEKYPELLPELREKLEDEINYAICVLRIKL